MVEWQIRIMVPMYLPNGNKTPWERNNCIICNQECLTAELLKTNSAWYRLILSSSYMIITFSSSSLIYAWHKSSMRWNKYGGTHICRGSISCIASLLSDVTVICRKESGMIQYTSQKTKQFFVIFILATRNTSNRNTKTTNTTKFSSSVANNWPSTWLKLNNLCIMLWSVCTISQQSNK